GSPFACRVAADISLPFSPLPRPTAEACAHAPILRPVHRAGCPLLYGCPAPDGQLYRSCSQCANCPTNRPICRALSQGEGSSLAWSRDAQLADALSALCANHHGRPQRRDLVSI